MPLTLTRSLIVVLVPGIVSIAPWAFWFAMNAPRTTSVYDTHQVAGNALLFAVVVIVGSVMEGIGSRLEVKWDRKREPEFKVQENWYNYLSLTLSAEPVGFRYLSRCVTTMYFELSMVLASASLLLGIAAVLVTLDWEWKYWTACILAVLAGCVAWFFYSEAHDTHGVLCKVRQELVKRLAKESAKGSNSSEQ
jgi:hypothetical protein